MSLRILHFADAHIDIATHGQHDPETGLPARVVDFLKALDTIVDTAITERVDMVLFAGDAYRDRAPAPTYQREWGRRIIRLSQAGIPTLLLVGNHDVSPAAMKAHTLQEYDTLQVPHVRVLDKPALFSPADLEGLPLQVIALPWVSRSALMAALDIPSGNLEQINNEVEVRLIRLLQDWMNQVDLSLPTILTAHVSVQGATYGGERSVMLGSDMVLSGSVVRDPRLDYVALGHIHKAQNLNEGQHPPVIYPGSIERVNFGEAGDEKFFVIAHVERGQTRVEWRKLEGRRFIDRAVRVKELDGFMQTVLAALPAPQEMADAMVRLKVEYPRELEGELDEKAIREHAKAAFDFQLHRQPQSEARLRLSADQNISGLTHLELLDIYIKSKHTNFVADQALRDLAQQIIGGDEPGVDA